MPKKVRKQIIMHIKISTIEIDAHILVSFMKFAGMKSISGKLFNVFALFRGIVVLYDFGKGGGGGGETKFANKNYL